MAVNLAIALAHHGTHVGPFARLAALLGERAARALSLLDSVRSDLRINVNGRLAAERILIEVAR